MLQHDDAGPQQAKAKPLTQARRQAEAVQGLPDRHKGRGQPASRHPPWPQVSLLTQELKGLQGQRGEGGKHG